MAKPLAELDGTEPIADEELVFRRIPVSTGWYDPAVSPQPSPLAFRPRDDDDTGLSIVRGHPYNTPETAARGPAKRGYFVAVFRVGDLRRHGFHVDPKPVLGVLGHAEITDLTSANRDSDEIRSMIVKLAHELCLRIEGPFNATPNLPHP